MTMIRRIASAAVVVVLSAATGWGQTVAPTSKPASPEMMVDKSAIEGYGKESYRMVDERDEVVSVLQNGLVVICKRISSPVLTVRGYCRTGGVYEGKWLGGGLSHLLEHLVAGGSSERRTEAENRNLLQEIGNNSNAFTTEDMTAFFVNTTPEHLDQATDLVTGWMLGAKITRPEYTREYQVVQRELEKGKGEPDRQFYYMAAMNRYRVSPARVPVIGYQEVIQGLSRDDVYEYYKQAYQPNNLVFALAGDMDPEKMLKAVQKFVSDAKPGRVFSHDIAAEPPVVAPRTVVATFPKLGQARVMIAYPTISLNNPDLYALDLLATILGGGESSVLVEELRDKQQIVSGISAESSTPSYVEGDFDVAMHVPPERVQDAIKAAKTILQDVKTHGVDPGRIERAKAQMRASRVRQMLTAEDVAESLASDYMNTGDPHFTDLYTKRIQAVTPKQLQAAARKYFDDGKLITTVMLPAEYVGAKGLPRAVDLVRPASPATEIAEAGGKASDVRRVEMSNGTILLLKRLPTAPVVSINMYALGGVTAENAQDNGIGNLTMDMLMRGTQARSAEQIAEFFDSHGADMETACGNNSWYWTASCMKDDFGKVLEAYGDIVNHPTFADAELPQMKKRIVAAIDSEDSDWTQQAFRYFKQQFFGPINSPYQFLPIGLTKNVQTITREQLNDWYAQKVLTARRVLAIYGDIDLDQAQKLAEQYLGQGEKIAGAPPANECPEVKGPDTNKAVSFVERVEVQKTEQPLAGVVIGYRSGPVIGDPSNFPIAVADTMCSGYTYPTGYLHEILRGRGLVYVVQAQNIPGREKDMPGTFVVYAGCDARKVNEVVDVILENIARLQGTPQEVNEKWYERSKQLITTSEAMQNETPTEQASTAALDELFGMGYEYHKSFTNKINAVMLDEVRAISHQRLWSCVVTISTPDPSLVQIKTGERTYDKFAPVDLTPRGVQHDTGGAGK
ncbi:MAG TPA: pitrilysin family protein [Tepidisphaeraceae bacterium]|jgi:zinc protease|nr:pitrilysin family protein [Tepidisphaeraceae bacterium]